MNIIEKLIKALLSKPTISLQDRMVIAYLKGKPMPLKGHTRVIFTDVNTGEERVVADTTNMVTNAVASILSYNWSGLANFSTLLPLKSLYSGVLCFQNAITENADNYNPPNDTVNPLIAHAGQSNNDTANTMRGNPVISDIVETDTSVKWVWAWDSSHGNGTIRTVCLCPDTLGNMGLKPFDDTMNPLSTFGNDSTTNDTWNLTTAIQFPMSIATDGKTSKTVWIDNATFTEYTVRHDYTAFGIMRGSRDWQNASNRSATIRTGSSRFVFEDDNYYYIARVTGATTMQIDKVAKTDFAVTQADATFSGISLYTGTIDQGKNGNFKPYAFDGTNLYFPNSTADHFIRLNLTNNADVAVLDGTITIETINASDSNVQFAEPIVINSGLVLGSNYIINGTKTYPIAHTKGIGGADTYLAGRHWLWLVRQGAAVYGNAKQTYGTSSSQWSGQSNVLCQMFLSTINVLEEPVIKTNTVAMRIEYTITET